MMRTGAICAGVVLLLLCLACSRGDDGLAGVYRAESDNGKEVELLLKENREGEWTVDAMPVTFRWEPRDGEVWLRTKDGGIVAGEVKGDSITLDLPGVGLLEFTRT